MGGSGWHYCQEFLREEVGGFFLFWLTFVTIFFNRIFEGGLLKFAKIYVTFLRVFEVGF